MSSTPEPSPAPADTTTTMTPADCAAQLKDLFPALFGGAPKPLKLRIQADIQERAPGRFTKQVLSAFLRRYTGATAYLVAVSKGTQRFDLDGQPAGELSEEHRKVAADELARRRATHDARRAQEEQDRRQRAALLRDFETTTLTLANFCALKGIAPEALEGQLAIARQEALERPPQRPGQRPGQARRDHPDQRDRRDHRGPGGPRQARAADGQAADNTGDRPRRQGRGPRPEPTPRG